MLSLFLSSQQLLSRLPSVASPLLLLRGEWIDNDEVADADDDESDPSDIRGALGVSTVTQK